MNDLNKKAKKAKKFRPEGDVRKVLMSVELMEEFATRDENGNLLIWTWGEPDEDGFYTPTVTVDERDHLTITGGLGDKVDD